MYFHVYLIYRFTRTFTDHSSVITRCWGFELQNGKSSFKSPQTLATQGFAPASFLSTPDKKKSTAWRCFSFCLPPAPICKSSPESAALRGAFDSFVTPWGPRPGSGAYDPAAARITAPTSRRSAGRCTPPARVPRWRSAPGPAGRFRHIPPA